MHRRRWLCSTSGWEHCNTQLTHKHTLLPTHTLKPHIHSHSPYREGYYLLYSFDLVCCSMSYAWQAGWHAFPFPRNSPSRAFKIPTLGNFVYGRNSDCMYVDLYYGQLWANINDFNQTCGVIKNMNVMNFHSIYYNTFLTECLKKKKLKH